MLVNAPPMGWNSWNTFGENISDSLIREMADQMVSGGYLDAGYNYLVIDDCWSLRERDENGFLVPDPAKFPNGMKAVADYVHSKGLKFGMYSCVGVRTCAGYPGSYGHEYQDAQTFADWGVDFLKYDYCHKPAATDGDMLYRRMGMALRATGRDILFSACNWGMHESEKWMRSVGAHMYRSTGDISDNYASFTGIAASQEEKQCYGTPQCFNDMDMLIVGMYGKGNVALGGCNDAEYRQHFAMWCLFSSPLMIGADLRSLNEESKALLLNKNLLSINQDPEVRPAFRILKWDLPVYFKHLSGGEYAMGVFNTSEKDHTFYCPLTDFGLCENSGFGMIFTDVFTGEESAIHTSDFPVSVPSHDCKVYKVRLVKL